LFRFKKNDDVGAASAEDDAEFLSKCFVDTGDLSVLEDIENHKCILLGRTGVGKSALLERLREKYDDQVVSVSADGLALNYIANSNVIDFFLRLGVNLEPFYKLLWRHVLTVEVLQAHVNSDKDAPQKSIVERLLTRFGGASRKDKEVRETIEYLRKWGEKFWLETSLRVKEITKTLEKDLESRIDSSLKAAIASSSGSISAASKLSEEERSELHHRGQEVVAKAQIHDLSRVISMLDTVLGDKQRHYYIVIDRLDEDWVDDKLRYKLIMALIVTAREMSKVHNAKMIVAMRRDLIERVFRLARSSGFQEEKFQSLYLPVSWTSSHLIEVLDRRINQLVSKRYSPKDPVSHRDLLPDAVAGEKITSYILQRATRPRDIISLFNACIEVAVDKGKLTATMFKEAEGNWSRQRLRALADEWSADYPDLLDFTSLLNGRSASFKLATITDREIEDKCLDAAIRFSKESGDITRAAFQVVDGAMEIDSFRRSLAHICYKIGLAGVKLSATEKESWSDERGRSVSVAEITSEVSLVIHPAYYRALATRDR
jgi:hypothetical protein